MVMLPKRLLIAGLLLFALGVTIQAIDSTDGDMMTVAINNPDGQIIGAVNFREFDGYVQIIATLTSLEPGFHGFHIHEFGRCEVTDEGAFLSAGGHYDQVDEQGNKGSHGDHAGDLPMLLVLQDGSAYLSFHTDRFVMADLMDADGSAMIIHSGADNYANIPERYGGPDATTLAAGDAGSRVGCGIIAPPQT